MKTALRLRSLPEFASSAFALQVVGNRRIVPQCISPSKLFCAGARTEIQMFIPYGMTIMICGIHDMLKFHPAKIVAGVSGGSEVPFRAAA